MTGSVTPSSAMPASPASIPEWIELAGVTSGWPAVENQTVGPWMARAGDGITRWANSVFVPPPPPLAAAAPRVLVASPDELIAAAEAFYLARQLPCRFRLSGPLEDQPDDSLATALLGLGYRQQRDADGWLWISELRPLRASAPVERLGRVRIDPEPTDAWLERWWAWLGRPDSQRSGAMELLSMLERHAGFAAHVNGPDLLALAIGVVNGPWLAVHDLLPTGPPAGITTTESPATGSLRRVISALATWGIAHAARRAHIELPTSDIDTGLLLESIGFRPAAQVRYFEQG